MPLCLGGNRAELGECCMSWQSGVQSITQGLVWSARAAWWVHSAEGAQCGTAGTLQCSWGVCMKVLCSWAEACTIHSLFPKCTKCCECFVCPKQLWSWYIETPLGAALWTLAGLPLPGCGVCCDECVLVCACVCSAFVCVCTVHMHLLPGVNCRYVYMYRYLYMY